MQLKKPVIAAIAIAIAILVIIFAIRGKGNKYEYYYTFKDDDNLVSQTIQIYDKHKDLKGRYILYYEDKAISTTASDSAVVTTMLCDLSKHPVIQIQFLDSKEKHDVVYKKG